MPKLGRLTPHRRFQKNSDVGGRDGRGLRLKTRGRGPAGAHPRGVGGTFPPGGGEPRGTQKKRSKHSRTRPKGQGVPPGGGGASPTLTRSLDGWSLLMSWTPPPPRPAPPPALIAAGGPQKVKALPSAVASGAAPEAAAAAPVAAPPAAGRP